ncbi:hypothetical protein [uncultured Helicobacter sp.]|uniref:hypothetical protein n=1 Tax=uncultured Helicobacter sp. TaxID=175537 RepID=UPI00375073CC
MIVALFFCELASYIRIFYFERVRNAIWHLHRFYKPSHSYALQSHHALYSS